MKKSRKMAGAKKQIIDVRNEEEALLLLTKLENELEVKKEELAQCQALRRHAKARMDDTDRKIREIEPIIELLQKPLNYADSHKDK